MIQGQVIPRPEPLENRNYKPKFVHLICPVCHKPFPYSAPRYAYLVRNGQVPFCCSRKCGWESRRMKKAAAVHK